MGYATEFVRLCNVEWNVEYPAPSQLQSYLTAVQTTFRERYEEHARTVKRVKVASTVVGRSALPLATNGTQEPLLQPGPRLVVGDSGGGLRNFLGKFKSRGDTVSLSGFFVTGGGGTG